MQRNPNYFFKGRDAIGIFDVPIESMIIIDQPETNLIPGDLRIVVKIANGSMVETSNIGEFIDDPTLWREGIGQPGQDGQDGKDGQDGRHGVDGSDGINGIDGQDGPRGQKGEVGLQGIAGLDGNDGNDGFDGVDGINGTNGQDGIAGTEGPRGATGPRGLDGPNGVNGVDGTDGIGVVIKGTQSIAHILSRPNPQVGDMWIANNSDATASIPGIPGDGYVCAELIPGILWENVGPIRGPRGHQGPHGSHGIDGQDGVDGQRGATGATGAIGITGPRGIQGPKGDKGDKGDKGSTYSDRELLEKIKRVDGTGSGLDADKFDGRDSTDFAKTKHNHPISDVDNLSIELSKKIEAHNYASTSKGGTVKMRLSGSTLYITNDGSNA